jgi:hypothetical protein
MFQSVEMRWFLRIAPFSANSFFSERPEPRTRTDWYAFPCDKRSGVKIREGNYEVKLQSRNLGEFAPDVPNIPDMQSEQPAGIGRLEEWQKWSVPFPLGDIPSKPVLAGAGWVPVEKTRRMRLFSVKEGSVRDISADTSIRIENGCQVEYTELCAKGEKWWTIGLEAFGRPELLTENIRTAANHFFATLMREVEDDLRGFELKNSYGYPAWLKVLDSQ